MTLHRVSASSIFCLFICLNSVWSKALHEINVKTHKNHINPEEQDKGTRLIGQKCTRDSVCAPAHTVCNQGACRCCDTMFAVDSETCVRGLGHACQSPMDCQQKYTTCDAGVCVCEPGHRSYDGSCHVPVAVAAGQKCRYDVECSKSNAFYQCRNGQCTECTGTNIGKYSYRIEHGPSCKEGKVEVRNNEVDNAPWSGICNSGWNINNANVLCQSLGYSSADDIYRNKNNNDVYAKSKKRIDFEGLMTDVQCNGKEQALHYCEWSGKANCKNESVSVKCK